MSILNKLKFKKTPKTQISGAGVQVNTEKSPLQSASSPRQSAFVLRQPWITERAGDMMTHGKYIFIIDKNANKSEVRKAVESIYKVKVKNVNVINMKGKTRRLGRTLGRTSASKKAIVTLKEGYKIETI